METVDHIDQVVAFRSSSRRIRGSPCYEDRNVQAFPLHGQVDVRDLLKVDIRDSERIHRISAFGCVFQNLIGTLLLDQKAMLAFLHDAHDAIRSVIWLEQERLSASVV